MVKLIDLIMDNGFFFGQNAILFLFVHHKISFKKM